MCGLLPVEFVDYLTPSSQHWLILISPQGFGDLTFILLSQELASDVPRLSLFHHMAGIGRLCLLCLGTFPVHFVDGGSSGFLG